jgi:hypothetical protein
VITDTVTMSLRELPARESDGWTEQHYAVRLRYRGQVMRLAFHRGREGAQAPAPTVDLVLKALLDDAATLANSRSMEEWAGELGMDLEQDARSIRRDYARVTAQTAKLERLLGEDYLEFLWGARGPELSGPELGQRIQQAQEHGQMGAFASLQEMAEREGWDGGARLSADRS